MGEVTALLFVLGLAFVGVKAAFWVGEWVDRTFIQNCPEQRRERAIYNVAKKRMKQKKTGRKIQSWRDLPGENYSQAELADQFLAQGHVLSTPRTMVRASEGYIGRRESRRNLPEGDKAIEVKVGDVWLPVEQRDRGQQR